MITASLQASEVPGKWGSSGGGAECERLEDPNRKTRHSPLPGSSYKPAATAKDVTRHRASSQGTQPLTWGTATWAP